jgi:hypothetical protein
MISTKPVSLNAHLSIRDNLDPDSNLTEESDLHLEKHLSLKSSTDLGMKKYFRLLYVNDNDSIRDNFDGFSIPTDFICRMHSEAIDSISEGSQSLIFEKFPEAMDETYRITPSTTLNRGQNSELILQNIWLH